MKRVVKIGQLVGCLALAGLVSCEQPEQIIVQQPQVDTVQTIVPEEKKSSTKKIKLAILLDTSGSMKGLIEQAKNQLWKMVMQLAKIKDPDGNDPEIELALYQYGNSGLSMDNGYIQQISEFTTELDEISEQLFALRTNGGSEYCGTVIKTSLNDLNWSLNDSDLQIIFIAGNEEFTQGEVPYGLACNMANDKNVVVNTIFCGNYQEGVNTFWKNGAALTGGRYMNIDHDAQIKHYDSPFDPRISVLNQQLNQTYIYYGRQGYEKKTKQIEQDRSAQSLGSANATKRYLSKGSKVYKNTSWDLVDASDKKSFDLKKIENSQLPTEMQSMSEQEKQDYIKSQKTKRTEIKLEMKSLNKQRDTYVAKKRSESIDSNSNHLDDVIISAIVEQAQRKNYSIEKDIN